jgi:hypothetical protein
VAPNRSHTKVPLDSTTPRGVMWTAAGRIARCARGTIPSTPTTNARKAAAGTLKNVGPRSRSARSRKQIVVRGEDGADVEVHRDRRGRVFLPGTRRIVPERGECIWWRRERPHPPQVNPCLRPAERDERDGEDRPADAHVSPRPHRNQSWAAGVSTRSSHTQYRPLVGRAPSPGCTSLRGANGSPAARGARCIAQTFPGIAGCDNAAWEALPAPPRTAKRLTYRKRSRAGSRRSSRPDPSARVKS